MGKASRNEQAKATASLLNSLAAGVAITGFVVPTWGLFNGTMASPDAVSVTLVAASAFAVFLHIMARHYAGRVED